MGIIIAILIFGLIVIFHEFGHFLLARKNGIRVNEFMIGLGPRLFGVKKGDTLYSVHLIPFGGACMMAGEDQDDNAEGTFNSKSVWARMSVILAGPFFNFILAFVFSIFFLSQTGVVTGEIFSVEESAPAAQVGIQAGDKIKAIDGERIVMFEELQMHMALHPSDSYDITFERDGVEKTVSVATFNDNGRKRIGIGAQAQKVGFIKLLGYSAYEVVYNVKLVIVSLKMLVMGQLNKNDVTGPVGMVSMIGNTYQEVSQYGVMSVILTMVNLIIILSSNLGVMNLLPLPALDGGRILFLIVEAIRRKPVDRNKEGLVNFIGFLILMALMVFVMFNDIMRLINGG